MKEIMGFELEFRMLKILNGILRDLRELNRIFCLVDREGQSKKICNRSQIHSSK